MEFEQDVYDKQDARYYKGYTQCKLLCCLSLNEPLNGIIRKGSNQYKDG